jgi:DNA invertase Pin-like site-specific DNA recombinase
MGNVLGYTRTSAGERDISWQTARLTRAGAIKVFCDIGSDRSHDRPGLQGLLEAARTGDAIGVVRLDRLGRTVTEMLTTVETLKQRGIALVSLDEKIDTRSAGGALILHLLGAMARCERRLAMEQARARIADGVTRARRRGRPPLEAEKVSAALRLVEAGLSPAAVARQLRLGRSTVYRVVSRAGIARVSPLRDA